MENYTRIEALEKAYEMEQKAIDSKFKNNLEPIPFHWIFEEFCKTNNIKCSFDFVNNKYILS
jgi:hypothetical protein